MKRKNMSKKEIEETYYTTYKGFQPLSKLWKRVEELGLKISYNDLRKILEQQETYQINKQVRKPKEFSNVVANHPLESVQLDICIYDRFQLHKYKYIIGMIDVYSRFVVARPLTNMRMNTIMSSVKEMIDELGDYPKNLNCDNQFNVPAFTKFFS